MIEVRKQVEGILRNYMAMKRDQQALGFELKRITPSLHPEAIRDKVFARSGHEPVSMSSVSDKTSGIAIEHVDSQRNGAYHALSAMLQNINIEILRLEEYMSLLPENEAGAIRQFYFERMGRQQIAELASCSVSTVKRWKNDGLDKLVHFYTLLNNAHSSEPDLRARVLFIGCIHEERFKQCLSLADKYIGPGIEAMLYILSGCNELWQAGVEKFFNYESGAVIGIEESGLDLSEEGRMLLRLAYHLADGFNREYLIHDLWYYVAGLNYVHLELAIEALKFVLFPENLKVDP